MTEFFTDVTERIRYEGPDSDNPLAFHWYDADRVVAGRRMEDHLRFAVCYWHSFNWDGFDIFGAGTLDRPWHPTFAPAADPIEAATQKMAAAFEFFEKLGVPYYCFHDRDIAPEGGSFKESAALLDQSKSALAALPDWEASAIHGVIRSQAEAGGFGLGRVAQPIRVAVAGGSVSPPIDQTLAILGRQETLARLEKAIAHAKR